MKHTLTLHQEASIGDKSVYGSGTVFIYRVGGMPAGEEAMISNCGAPTRNDWRILRIKGGIQSKWTGHYESAEAALAVLQREVG